MSWIETNNRKNAYLLQALGASINRFKNKNHWIFRKLSM